MVYCLVDVINGLARVGVRTKRSRRQMFIDNNVMKFACAICGPFGGSTCVKRGFRGGRGSIKGDLRASTHDD